MSDPNVNEQPEGVAGGSSSATLLGLTVTRIDFNLSRGSDKVSTHYSITMKDGLIHVHGSQSHTKQELTALAEASHQIQRHVEAAERDHRYAASNANLTSPNDTLCREAGQKDSR